MAALRLLVALTVFLASSGVARAGAAAPAERRAACRDAASAFEDVLASEESRLLRKYCENDEMSPEWYAEQRRDPRFQRLVARLSSHGDWEAKVLFRLLPTALFEPVRYDWTCQKPFNLGEHVRKVIGGWQEEPTHVALAMARQSALPEGCAIAPATSGPSAARTQNHSLQGRVPLLVLAPPGMQVRLLASNGEVSLEMLGEARDGHPKLTAPAASSNFALYAALVPHGARYFVAIEHANGLSAPDQAYSAVLQGSALGAVRIESTESLRSKCLDLQVKAETSPRILVDGLLIASQAQGELHRVTPSIIAANEQSQHRLTIFLGKKLVVNRSVTLDGSLINPCVELQFDLTTKKQDDTIGLIDVNAEACIDAGIDTPRLLSYVQSYLLSAGRGVRDLRSWTLAAQYVADLRKTAGDLGGSPIGADRGRLDSMRNLGSGAQELMRQGFASLLLTELRCSRRPSTGWDYSFIARHFNLKEIQSRPRDIISGINLDDIDRTSIELVTDRAELGPRIDGVLGRLLGIPTLVVDPIPPLQPYIERIRATAEVSVPEQRRAAKKGYIVSFATRSLSPSQAQDICPRLDDIHRLRIRRDFENLSRGTWRVGSERRFERRGTGRIALEMEPDSSSTALVRTTLAEARGQPPLAASYTCVDLSREGAELWSEIGGWFPIGSTTAARTEDSSSLYAAIGIDWQQAAGWLSIGSGIGFSHTARSGQAPSTWAGLGRAQFEADGTSPYTIDENAVYLLLHAQARGTICQPWWPTFCNSATRRMMLTARLMAMPGLHLVKLDDVDPSLTEFTEGARANDLVDIGLFFQPGFAVQFSKEMTFNARLSFGTHRLLDFFSRLPGQADVYRRVLWGASMGLAWDY